MTAAPRNIPCSADRTAPLRTASTFLLAATLALAACSTSTGTEGGEASRIAPYNAMAILPPAANPDELLGLSGDEVTVKLGRPALIRREGGAEIWQYRRTDCVLDLFMYGSAKQVEHVDLRDRGDANESAVRACYQRMLEKPLESS